MTRRGLGVIGLGLLLAGCATAAPIRDARAEEIQQFVNVAAREHLFGLIDVVVIVHPGTAATWRSDLGIIQIQPSFLTSEHLWPGVAHETAHYLLMHYAGGKCAHSWQRGICEQDANARGVSLLAKGRGLTEAEALSAMYRMLAAQHRRSPKALPGHVTPCEEIADLLGRFPQHRALWQTWECSP